jgi:proline-specific peptidase
MKNLMKQRLYERVFSILFVIFLLCSCSGNKDSKSKQPILAIGESHLAVPGGNIWYKVTGIGTGTPVVLLHGGPGMSSYYLKPFEDLGNDRQVIRYDQLGGGKSDKITDTTLFTINHFVQELDSLREHLGLAKWHVFGHSWGTILALEYYRAHPDRVVSLTFGGACFNIPAYEKRALQLLTTLPDSLQQAVKRAEANGKFDDPGYQNAMNQFYGMYVWRNPVQADLDSMFSTFNTGIYVYMQGPSEFTITGTLKKYDATSFLSQIKVPTLFTVGEFDEVGPEIVKDFSDKVFDSRYILFKGASHVTSWDARDENLKVVRDFLNSVDSLAAKSNH